MPHGKFPGQQLIEDDSERVEIRPVVDLLGTLNLLGRSVGDGAERRALAGDRLQPTIGRTWTGECEAEVDDFDER